MRPPSIAQVVSLGLLLPPGFAVAQQTPHFNMSLSWMEVIAGSNVPVAAPNSVLDPGEAARISLSMSFTPDVGTLVSYQTPSPGGIGRLAGFSTFVFGLEPTNALGGFWSHLTLTPGFQGELVPWLFGGVGYAAVQQPYPTGSAVPIPDNPLPNVWQAVWTPESYEQRLVGFQLSPFTHGAQVYVETGLSPPGQAWGQGSATSTIDEVEFSVVPAPHSAALLILMLAVPRRKQRRS